jgi:ubiquinone/menaquinone biosynthesis C-methylase UbiE
MRQRAAAASIAAMSSIPDTAAVAAATDHGPRDGYSLGRTAEEYERLRSQARVWEAATGRLLDQVELAPGARCLDAGCGPGETMRLMAQRVGPAGRVCGIDVDKALRARALAALHAAGHHHCSFEPADVLQAERIPGAPFDLVFARLLLFHLADPVAALRRLWDWVAPGGHLVVQDYDLRTVDVAPPLDSVQEFKRVVPAAFTGAGCDIHVGHRLPLLFADAGIGAPDGTDVAGRLEPLATTSAMVAAVYRSLLPVALQLGLTTEQRAAEWFAQLARDTAEHAQHAALWPLLIGAWKRKPYPTDPERPR